MTSEMFSQNLLLPMRPSVSSESVMMQRVESIVITDGKIGVGVQQQLNSGVVLLGDGVVDRRVGIDVLQAHMSIDHLCVDFVDAYVELCLTPLVSRVQVTFQARLFNQI